MESELAKMAALGVSRATEGERGVTSHVFDEWPFRKVARERLKSKQIQTNSIACAPTSLEAQYARFGTTVLFQAGNVYFAEPLPRAAQNDK